MKVRDQTSPSQHLEAYSNTNKLLTDQLSKNIPFEEYTF
jgi:hypothetical protein